MRIGLPPLLHVLTPRPCPKRRPGLRAEDSRPDDLALPPLAERDPGHREEGHPVHGRIREDGGRRGTCQPEGDTILYI